MRKWNVLKGDIMFQWKYGFYFLYFIMVILYFIFLSLLSGTVKHTVAAICIYSDPAAMGMFFMGAIILLEKSQRIVSSLAVSPLKAAEYVGGKVISIAFISVVVGLLIVTQGKTESYFLTTLGIFAGSVIFSLCGVIVGTKISTINQYIVGTLPFEIIGFLPVIIYRIGIFPKQSWYLLHPGCAVMDFIDGTSEHILLCFVSILFWILFLYGIAIRCVRKMFAER